MNTEPPNHRRRPATSRKRTQTPALRIPDIHDFDAEQAATELLAFGFTAVDDISGQLVECALEELDEALGLAGDSVDLVVDEVDTGWGPVFVFRDRGRVTRQKVRALVLKERPAPPA